MKNNAHKITQNVVLIVMFITLASVATVSMSDDDGEYFWQRTKNVGAVNNPVYTEECGSCHFAYPPGFLPAASWNKMMGQLDDHFGDNAELEPDTQQKIQQYLIANSADKASFRYSRGIMRSIDSNNPPLRITEISYFRHKHNEIPQRLIEKNEKVGSLSNCTACHTRANEASFSEREVRIAGYGEWDE